MSVMHWHDEARLSHVRHGDGLFQCAMGTDPRLVGADAHDGEIIGPAITKNSKSFVKAVSRQRRPAPLAFDHVAVISAAVVVLQPCTPSA